MHDSLATIICPPRRGALLPLLLAAISGCAAPVPRTAPAPDATAHAPLSRDERWRADLRVLAEQLPVRHVNMYRHTTPAAFAREVALLDSALPRLTDTQLRLRLIRLTSMVRDEHTGAQSMPRPSVRLPFETLWMDDGPHVVAASAPYAALVGRRIVAYDGHPIGVVTDTLRRYVPHESEMGFRRQAENVVVLSTVLHGLGFASDSLRVVLDVASPAGERTRVPVDAVPWAGYAPVPPSGDAPAYRRRLEEKYWFALLPESGTLFIKYNQCRDPADFRRMTDSVAAVLDTGRVARVVVDLRHNTGGDDAVLRPLVEALRARPAFTGPRKLFAIIGRGTVSSGLSAANDLRRRVDAMLIGEPPGPNGFGNVRSFQLPHSKIAVGYATKDYQAESPTSAPPRPDALVPPDAAASAAGRDPALEWILARR